MIPQPEEKTVLVVDDEPNVREYLAQILRDAGFNVVTACDGDEALDLIHRALPDFISLDLVMPRKSGHKLLYELRKDKQLSRIPVVVVTAHAQDELGKDDLQDIMQHRVISGPGVYLEKPVRPDTYVAAVRRLLSMEGPETPAPEPEDLRRELSRALSGADRETLQRALDALRKK